jgi:hypothetical protein
VGTLPYKGRDVYPSPLQRFAPVQGCTTDAGVVSLAVEVASLPTPELAAQVLALEPTRGTALWAMCQRRYRFALRELALRMLAESEVAA